MATGLFAQNQLWDPTQAPSVSKGIAAYDTTARHKQLGKYTSAALLLAAINALPSAQRAGCIGHVMGKGIHYYTGTQLKRIDSQMIQAGYGSGVVQPTGLMITLFPTPFAANTVPVVTVGMATSDYNRSAIVIDLFTGLSGSANLAPNSASFHIRAKYADPSSPATGVVQSGFVEFTWTAVGIPPDDV